MSSTLTYDGMLALLASVADDMIATRDTLTELDAVLGDGDLGRTIDRGFRGIKEALTEAAEAADRDLGKMLFRQGKAFANAAPSSFGALMGTAFMKGGMALKGQSEATTEDLTRAMQTALEALMERGKAEIGNKTMLDALHPAIEATRAGLAADPDMTLAAYFRAAADAANAGAEKTRNMQSQIGRASWQGERSIGQMDPGAKAVALMLDAAARHFE